MRYVRGRLALGYPAVSAYTCSVPSSTGVETDRASIRLSRPDLQAAFDQTTVSVSGKTCEATFDRRASSHYRSQSALLRVCRLQKIKPSQVPLGDHAVVKCTKRRFALGSRETTESDGLGVIVRRVTSQFRTKRHRTSANGG